LLHRISFIIDTVINFYTTFSLPGLSENQHDHVPVTVIVSCIMLCTLNIQMILISGCDKEQHRRVLPVHPDTAAHAVHGRRRDGQEGVPGHMEGHPLTERGPVHHHQRPAQCRYVLT